MPAMSFADSSYTPSIWPVLGHITDSFGERLDPFSGEGAFHTGVDVATDYGAPVHATADGIITIGGGKPCGLRPLGSDRSRILASPPGMRTCHRFRRCPAARVKRGEWLSVTPGSAAAPPARMCITKCAMNNAPINPWRYMRAHSCRRLSLPKLCCPIILNSVSCGFL